MQFRLKALVAAGLIATGGAANALIVDFYDGTNLIATMETSLGTVFELDFVAAPSSGAFIDYINLAGPGGLRSGAYRASTGSFCFSELP